MVGMVVKQALILTRLLGWRIDMDDMQVSLVLKLENCNINDGNNWYSQRQWFFSLFNNMQVESLYPKELGPNSMSIEDFLRIGILTLDRGIQERANAASSRSKVLRYVCVIEGSR